MRDFYKYYFIDLIYYFIEIAVFEFLLQYWSYNIIVLNLIIRVIFTSTFAIIVKRFMFIKSRTFYRAFFCLAALNPLFSSLIFTIFLKLLIDADVLHLKFISDVCTSVVFYIILKRTV